MVIKNIVINGVSKGEPTTAFRASRAGSHLAVDRRRCNGVHRSTVDIKPCRSRHVRVPMVSAGQPKLVLEAISLTGLFDLLPSVVGRANDYWWTGRHRLAGKVHFDACQPRWVSLALPLQIHKRPNEHRRTKVKRAHLGWWSRKHEFQGVPITARSLTRRARAESEREG